ncbi:glycoside hydrolase family protein [Variovorax sp. Sphag1AA]|uniref:glycoside hydrolase family protein n=1 Tax=Variovorax sp. Sphag1AA TaxID=2587027 RepID=UPI00161FD60C|nr:hemolysin [Variovorax sp. Sphag1AA]MBB3175806.1 GH24 family phage-related lysozyme (muramidase) [Variovorax sp. Sphag1AA]
MDYRGLTDEEYYDRLRIVVSEAEGLHARAQDVGDGKATIGYGYTFNRGNNADIWHDSGIRLTPREVAALAAIDAAPAEDRTRLGLTFQRELTEAESAQLLRASMREYEGPANSLRMPLSEERVAIVSLTYNRGPGALLGTRNIPEHPIMDAIREGNRAEAWFQMRYNCWGSAEVKFEGGLRKRRFAEAHMFGLYDDPSNVSPEEAQSVVQMHGLHRDEIDRVEGAHGVSIGGDQAKRNRIAEANRDYPAIVREYGRIQNIADSLEPARVALLGQVREENPALAARLIPENFSADRIHLDPNRDLRDPANVDQDLAAMPNRRNPLRAASINAIGREQRNSTTEDIDVDHAAVIDSKRMSRGLNPQEVSSNDVLIGQGGNDTLRSHLGDDILIGGSGHDRMEGGEGHDTYVIGAGDTVMDSDGVGEVQWAGQRLAGGKRTASDPIHSYRSEDGRFTYAVEGNNLSVTDSLATDEALRERAVIENFQNGQLGITLFGPNGNVDIRPWTAEQQPSEQEVQASHLPERGPFNAPYLDRTYAALQAGDSNQLDRIAIEFAQSPEGLRMAQLGDQLFTQQQAQEQQQLQEQQMTQARQSPVMRL